MNSSLPSGLDGADVRPLVKPKAKRPRKRPVGEPLSAKELEILRWAKEGKTVWEISVIRAISEATVKFHLRNIYIKLSVSNRAQAVGEAVKRGVLS
ncbi:helix-turn-helix transcriptional regulator [Pseudomonas sp. Irchel 3E20]|uniref:helix-turn-helix domain-containing protein n=1 Tax=Pseudomonas sp. Irchel 3E20 TaxID=2008983 RepID=UPI000BA3C67D|nr:helix-turn-helix transcriptional regulator [Pseudomonas sp. Irchel 3E20]